MGAPCGHTHMGGHSEGAGPTDRAFWGSASGCQPDSRPYGRAPLAPGPFPRDPGPPGSPPLTRQELESLQHPPLLCKVHHEVAHVVADLGFERQPEGRGHCHTAGEEAEAACWQASQGSTGQVPRDVRGGPPPLCPSPLFWAEGPSPGGPHLHTRGGALGWGPDPSILPIFDLLGSLERGTE